MAHFAEIDPSTKRVLRVVVVSNSVNTDDGPLGDNDMHPGGENWCGKNIKFGAIWKQTSYNHKFRKQFAGQGMFYDEAKDAFIKLQPHSSWTLDENHDWQPPVARPTGADEAGRTIWWEENNQRWVSRKFEDATQWNWDPGTSTWQAA